MFFLLHFWDFLLLLPLLPRPFTEDDDFEDLECLCFLRLTGLSVAASAMWTEKQVPLVLVEGNSNVSNEGKVEFCISNGEKVAATGFTKAFCVNEALKCCGEFADAGRKIPFAAFMVVL